MLEAQSYTLFAWIQGKKTKIGFGSYNEKYNCLRVKADPHLDATKIGRALMKGEIQIDARQVRPKRIAADEEAPFDPEQYASAADEYTEEPSNTYFRGDPPKT